MTRSTLAAALLLCATAAPAAAQHPTGHAVTAPHAEEAAVRTAMQDYLTAQATGQGEYIRRLFHPAAAMMFWVTDGTLSSRSGEEFAARFNGNAAADEDQRHRSIDWVDVTGDVAVAKVLLDYPDAFFTDYFALARVDGRWRVVTKIFHREGPRR